MLQTETTTLYEPGYHMKRTNTREVLRVMGRRLNQESEDLLFVWLHLTCHNSVLGSFLLSEIGTSALINSDSCDVRTRNIL